MPRPPRRSKSRRAGYDEEHVRHLLEGVYLCPGHGFATNPPAYDRCRTDWPAFREAWEVQRDTLMPQWIAEHPGQRPHAWWKIDAPEPRQRTDGIVHPFKNRIRQQSIEKTAEKNPSFRAIATELFYGKPRALIVRDDFDAQYETEEQFLRRLNLLTESEVEALAK